MGHVWAHITYPSIAHVAPTRCHFPNFNMGPMWECNNLPSGIPTICPHGYHVHGCLGYDRLAEIANH